MTTNASDRFSLRFTRRGLLVGTSGLGAAVFLGPLASGCSSDEEVARLSFLNWQDYIDEQLLEDFERRIEGAVVYETYASNGELSKRLSAAGVTRRRGRKASTFDLIVPSENLFRTLKDADALRELPRDIKGLDNLAKSARNSALDPGNRYGIPWARGTTGIAYRISAFPDGPPDWTVFTSKVDGGATLLDETRDAMAVAHFLNGTDPNSDDTAEIDAAGDTLASIAEAGTGFDAADYLDRFARGDLDVVQAFSSDAAQAILEDDDLAYVIPAAGGLRWSDTLCIPVEAPNPELAEKFIAFYLEPEVSAANAVAARIDTGNEAASEFLPEDLTSDTVVFPTDGGESLAVIEALSDDIEKRYSEAFEAAKAK